MLQVLQGELQVLAGILSPSLPVVLTCCKLLRVSSKLLQG